MVKSTEKSLFNFTTEPEELKEQIEFLLSYYVAKLKLLKSENFEGYITAKQAPEETFYKDVISACSLYLQETKYSKQDYEESNW